MKARVYLATTQGPVLVERIAREAAPRSAMCLKRTTRVLPVSAGYDAFVRAPSGVIDREFGPFGEGAFRLDVSGEIGDGDSWQLGVFVAHALWARGELAGPDDAFDVVLWLTGTVDGDLNIGAVGGVAAKIDASRVFVAKCVTDAVRVVFVLPTDNADGAGAIDSAVGDLVLAATVPDVLERLGVAPATARGAPRGAVHRAARRRFHWWWAVGGFLAAAAMLVLLILPRDTGDDVTVPPFPASNTPVTAAIVALHAPAGETCQAVLFGRVVARRVALTADADGGIQTTRGDDLCGLAFEVRAGRPAFVAAGLRMREGQFAQEHPLPPELGGAAALTGVVDWRVDLPVRQSRPIAYALFVLTDDAPISAAQLSRAMVDGAAPDGLQVLRHRIEAP
ncbi:MAG: hypothetical protein HQ495_00175 [Alphaproteobacteria bacterium]|nr:hypothetical protein [Alphaproteobacteria bacterium]